MGKTPKKNICTKCGLKVFPQDIRAHPTLGVAICSSCYGTYVEVGDISRYWRGVDLDGTDNYCRWCLDGGELILCNDNTCHSSFCKNCIERNFGKARAVEIEKSSDWYCFVCDRTQLENIQIKTTKKVPEKLSVKTNIVMTSVQKPIEKASAEKSPSARPSAEKTTTDGPLADKVPNVMPPVERPQIAKSPLEMPHISKPAFEKPPVAKLPVEKMPIEVPPKETASIPKAPERAATRLTVKNPAITNEKIIDVPISKEPEQSTEKAPEAPANGVSKSIETIQSQPTPTISVAKPPVEKVPIEVPPKETASIPKAPERAAIRLTVRNPVITTEKIIDVPIGKEPEKSTEKAPEAPANGVSKSIETTQSQPPPTQGTKRKLGRNLGIFSTSRICSRPKSEITPEVKKSIVEPVNDKPPVVEPVNEEPTQSNVPVSDKTVDLAAIEKELDISDNDSDFMDAVEVPPITISDATDVTEADQVWFPSTTADITPETNNASTPSDTEADVVMIDIVTKHDNPKVCSTQDTAAQDNDIFEALEAHKQSIDSRVMEWALKDADILRDRLAVHMKALQTAMESYDRSKFINDPKSLSSWASNLDSYMDESPAIRKRCYNLITHPSLNE